MGPVSEIIQNPAARAAAVAAVEGAGIIALTTMYNHRELTHDSLKLGPVLKGLARTSMRSVGMNPYVWAAAHGEGHHATPDANLVPVIETADYLQYRDEHPEIVEPSIPGSFASLDPVAVLTPADVREIGTAGSKLVEGRYDPPQSYSGEEAKRILDPAAPRYFYPDRPGFLRRLIKRENPVAPHELAPERSLESLTPALRDPHAPALHKKGIRGVWLDNPYLYGVAGEYFKHKANRPARLRQDPSDHIGEKPNWGKNSLIIGNIAVAGALLGGSDLADLARDVLVGGSMTIALAVALRQGGNITNAFGHGGEKPVRTFLKSVFSKKYRDSKPIVKPDGTFAADAKSLRAITLDEVDGQKVHHDEPGRIAYTTKTGFRKFVDAPFGSSMEFLADRNIGMAHGDGFGLKPGEHRPDEPSEAVLLLQEARVRTLNRKQEKTAELIPA